MNVGTPLTDIVTDPSPSGAPAAVMVAVAFADGILDEDEEDFLIDKAEEADLDTEEAEKIIKNAAHLVFMVPMNSEDREDQLADIVFMAMIDGEIHQKEYDLCLHIAQRLDMTKEDLDEAISLTKRLWGEK